MPAKPTDEQMQAFGAALRDHRHTEDLSSHALSLLMDEDFRRSGATLRNYEKCLARPDSAYVVLAIERALKRPRGSLIKLLGWTVPKNDRPAVTKPSQDELAEARLDRLERQLQAQSATLERVLQAVAARLKLDPTLLRADPDDR